MNPPSRRPRSPTGNSAPSASSAPDTPDTLVVPPGLPPLNPAQFETRLVPLGKIKRYHNNPRHNDKSVQKTAASIQEFGWRQPLLVDWNLEIIVGDTRYLAADLLGYPAAPCWIVKEGELTAAQIRAYRLADNRTHDEADWNAGALGVELQSLLDSDFDLSLTGFDEKELERYLASDDGAALEPMTVKPAPTMAWVLVGVPIHRYGEIAEEIERISGLEDVFCEVSANNDKLPQRKEQ